MISGEWTKSSFSNGSGGNNCVEVRAVAGGGRGVYVRHSNWPEGLPLDFTRAEWEAFVRGVKNGEFDLPDQSPQDDIE
jgi:hypothetical protein